MKLIKPFCIDYTQKGYDVDSIYKQIEKVGRICYKSEDRITETSSNEFVQRMVDSKHNAMLEHGTVYLTMDNETPNGRYIDNKYSEVELRYHDCYKPIYYITTNYRVLVENNWLEDLKYLTGPTKFHKKRVMARLIIDRGVSHKQFVA